MENQNGVVILRRKQVEATTGLSRSSIYALMKSPTKPFPKAVKLSARSVGWLKAEVLAYLDERVAESRGVSKGGA